MEAQPTSRRNSTSSPYLANNPNSCAMISGAESLRGTKPTRRDFVLGAGHKLLFIFSVIRRGKNRCLRISREYASMPTGAVNKHEYPNHAYERNSCVSAFA